ncbi:hypothetical protein CMI47_21730 [Candidatus Pacearchaeota archaeon]|nr:hypothetical protein [Candidatus Pacearchaeota archaeon]|tara:strand:- start:12 stop:503 length:492 start_codon:yes stop_codon:yes gene_type:complete
MRLKRKTLPVADRLRAAMSEMLFDDIEEYFFKGSEMAMGDFDKRAILEGRWKDLGDGFQQFMHILSNVRKPEPKIVTRTLLKYGIVLIEQTKKDKEYDIAFILAEIRGKIVIFVNKLNTEIIEELGEVVPKNGANISKMLKKISNNTNYFRDSLGFDSVTAGL